MTLLKVHGTFIKYIKSSMVRLFLGYKCNLHLMHNLFLVWLKGMVHEYNSSLTQALEFIS